VSAVNLDLFRYGWIHLLSAIVKEDSVSRQSSIDLFRYVWIHLHSTIVKENSVSRQSSIDLFRYVWIHLHTTIVKENSVKPLIQYTSIDMRLDTYEFISIICFYSFRK
jgi:hypothetical protein